MRVLHYQLAPLHSCNAYLMFMHLLSLISYHVHLLSHILRYYYNVSSSESLIYSDRYVHLLSLPDLYHVYPLSLKLYITALYCCLQSECAVL